MHFKLLLFTLTITTFCFSQNFIPSMEVLKNELETNIYEKDSTANAVVIYDYGNSFVDNKTFWLRAQVKQKIKILKPKGLERSKFEIRLYKGKSTKEKISDIKGITYNLENGVVRKSYLKKESIFRIEEEKYTLVKFVLPNVKAGSIITISYETQSRFMAKYQPWYFQGSDPVVYSEYNTSIPANYSYNIKLVGGFLLDTEDYDLKKKCLEVGNGGSADCAISKYVMTDIPAYKVENYTTTSQDYIARIEYELNEIKRFDGSNDKIAKTWKDVDGELKADKNFGKQVNKKSLVKDVLPEHIKNLKFGLDKLKAIHQYVLDTYKWNGKNERYNVSVKTLLKEKVGSTFEINLLLQNLLHSEGFESYPVLSSTRNNGLITKIFPVLTEFNFVIVKTAIDGEDYFLDATTPYLSFGQLPFKCLNQYGRLIDFENGSDWIDIKANKYSGVYHNVNLSQFKNNTFSGVLKSGYSGYYAQHNKQQYDENATSYKTQKINTYSAMQIDEHKVIDFDKTKFLFNEQISFDLETESIGNKIYLNPFIVKFFEENPFKLQERTFPVDFGYKSVYIYNININLKDNKIKAIEIPKTLRYALPNKSGLFIFNVQSTIDKLMLSLTIKFNTSIYPSEYYEALKLFMSKIVDAQNNSLILLEKQ